MKLSLLRKLLLLDAVVLGILGLCLIFVPKQIQLAFNFKDLPGGVSYMIGLWGCVVLTMSAGYVVAATNPVRHIIWIQVGIARGLLEAVLGAVFLARGIVTWSQAWLGIVLSAAVAAAYLLLYPRRPRLAAPGASTGKPGPGKP